VICSQDTLCTFSTHESHSCIVQEEQLAKLFLDVWQYAFERSVVQQHNVRHPLYVSDPSPHASSLDLRLSTDKSN
jgi:hypothetical protein